MPAGPVGGCWAAGSWPDTAWIADSWGSGLALEPATIQFFVLADDTRFSARSDDTRFHVQADQTRFAVRASDDHFVEPD